jgi:hypothetical protein
VERYYGGKDDQELRNDVDQAQQRIVGAEERPYRWGAGIQMSNSTIDRSTITCPSCGFTSDEAMPTDACQFFYECKGCGVLLCPKLGDCCVLCSYGFVPCPSIPAAVTEPVAAHH